MSWRRSSWISQQSRLFRIRRNALSLYHKLVEDDSGDYLPLVFVRIEELRAVDPEWIVLDDEVWS